MSKPAKQPETPRYPSVRRKCRYCGTQFNTPATYNGQQMKFCKPAHRKAFDKEGEKPIDVILKRQEKRMREIAREEIQAAIAARFDTAYCPSVEGPNGYNGNTVFVPVRTAPSPGVRSDSPRSS
jgi:hypothetical protein